MKKKKSLYSPICLLFLGLFMLLGGSEFAPSIILVSSKELPSMFIVVQVSGGKFSQVLFFCLYFPFIFEGYIEFDVDSSFFKHFKRFHLTFSGLHCF